MNDALFENQELPGQSEFRDLDPKSSFPTARRLKREGNQVQGVYNDKRNPTKISEQFIISIKSGSCGNLLVFASPCAPTECHLHLTRASESAKVPVLENPEIPRRRRGSTLCSSESIRPGISLGVRIVVVNSEVIYQIIVCFIGEAGNSSRYAVL